MSSNVTWGPTQRAVVIACFLGWTLDAFDFFLLVFVLKRIAGDFASDVTSVTWALFATLAMRPVGALLFGRLADRYGRRPALMASILLYSIMELVSALAPNLAVFITLRALFGIGMGGVWGVGAALAFESVPVRSRGLVSGILQAGYPAGYLLAAAVFGLCFDAIGWRGMFVLGAAPALLLLYMRRNVPESPAWRDSQRAQAGSGLLAGLAGHWPLVLYAVLLMTAFNFFSHGTQDLYKSFLTTEHKLSLGTTTAILICMNVAAILGGITCASLSQRFGRRRAIVTAALLSLPVLPFWAFAQDPLAIGVAAFGMQLCVQGAWGVIPAHLNELSPADVRGTFPGFTYTLGNLIASVNGPLQSGLADTYFHKNLSWPFALVVGTVAVSIALLVGFGREARDVRMGRERLPA